MAAEAGFGDEDIMKIGMAVREAAVNAVLHGNAYDPGRRLRWRSSALPRTWSSSLAIRARGWTSIEFPIL